MLAADTILTNHILPYFKMPVRSAAVVLSNQSLMPLRYMNLKEDHKTNPLLGGAHQWEKTADSHRRKETYDTTQTKSKEYLTFMFERKII